MNTTLKTLVVIYLPIMVSILALIQSCNSDETAKKALKVSEAANKVAEEALDFSKESFVTENRPYLVLSPVTFKDSGDYLKIARQGNAFQIEIKHRLENIGATIAHDIDTPKSVAIPDRWLKDGADFQFSFPAETALAPGEKLHIVTRIEFEMADELDAKNPVSALDSDEDGVKLRMVFRYSGLDPSVKYKTIQHDYIKKNSVDILTRKFE